MRGLGQSYYEKKSEIDPRETMYVEKSEKIKQRTRFPGSNIELSF